MSPRALRSFLLCICIGCATSVACAQDDDFHSNLKIVGPVSTKPLLVQVVKAIQAQTHLQVTASTDNTSLQALDEVAQSQASIALMTVPLTGLDRAQYPDAELFVTPIGMEVIALGVSDDVWDAGLHTITKESMQRIYEQKVTNWKQIGGPDEKITLFNFQQGAGVWEVFAEWLYGDNRKAPLPKVQSVASNEDAADDLEFVPGSVAPIGAAFADGSRCHPLGLSLGKRIVQPIPADVADGGYPIVRPLIAVTVGKPALSIRTITEFLTGPAGQALVKKTGSLGLDAVPKPTPTPPPISGLGD